MDNCPDKHNNLNADQLAAVDAIRKWYFLHPEEQFMTLSGAGGTGKTTMLANVIHAITDRFVFHQEMTNTQRDDSVWWMDDRMTFVVTATQNDPVSGLIEAGFTGAETIYTQLGLRVVEDNSTGQTHITPGKSSPGRIATLERANTLVIIDESSHIGAKMFHFLTTTKIRCLFMGDAAQLRCVGSENFSVFDKEYGIRTAELKINERAGCPDLKAMNAKLRQAVFDHTLVPIIHNGTSINVLDDATFLEELRTKSVAEGFKTNRLKVLTFRNATSHSYNKFVRDCMNRPLTPEVGDVILTNQRYSGNKVQKADFRPSTRLRVLSDHLHPSILARAHEAYPFGNLTGLTVHTDLSAVRRPKPISVITYTSPETREFEIAKAQAIGATEHKWKLYFQSKREIMDYRFPHSETTHKSQGRTYDYVFIDLPDLWDATNHDTILRLLYVAFSRARVAVYIRNRIPRSS